MNAERLAVETHTGFETCETELRDLHRRAGNENPFLSVDWMKLWWGHFSRDKSLCLLLFREGSLLVGCVPCYRSEQSGAGLSEYRLVGEGMSSYLDLICLPRYENAVVDALFTHFGQAKSSLLLLHDINDRFSRCYHALQEKIFGGDADASVFALYPCPMADLGKRWEDFFEQQRGKKSRYNLHRSERQLSDLGRWSFSEVTDPAEVSRLLPIMQRLHEERFSDTINPLFAGERRQFLASAIGELVARSVSLSVITLDDVPVSFLVGFRMGEVFIDYAPVFDPALSAVSIGHLHLMRLMAKAIGEGVRYFDFSKGEASYKRWWSNDETVSYEFRFGFNLTPAARLYLGATSLALRMLLKLRAQGHNARIKRNLAICRNWFRGTRGTHRVTVQRLPADSSQASSGLPWSYHIIRDLPVEVREAVVDCGLKAGPDGVRIDAQPGLRTITLLPEKGERYVVQY